MISVAAELAGMHPQTLRIYEDRGLIKPKRSPKGTRLYSQDDVLRLRKIQELTVEGGMNLVGVERVFELEEELGRLGLQLEEMNARADRLRLEMSREIERMQTELAQAQRALRAEMVPYKQAGALVSLREARSYRR